MKSRPVQVPWFQELKGSLADTYALPRPFAAPQKESAFLGYYGTKFAPFRRAAIGLGIVMWVVFFGWDFHHYFAEPEVFTPKAIVHLLATRAIGLLALVLTFCFTLRERFNHDRYAHIILINGVVAAHLCIVAMVAIVPAPLNYVYYFSGLYLVLIFQFGFAHLRSRSVLLCTIAGAAAVVFMQFMGTLDIGATFLLPEHFASAVFYYLSICLIGFGICVKFERYARQQFDSESRIAAANEALVQQNALLERSRETNRIKSRALLTAKEEQRERAVRASQDKSKFLASAAHDLRQPMFGLSLSLETLRHALQKEAIADAEKILDTCQGSVKSMVNSFNAILDLSRIESGFVQPEYTDFDLALLLEEIRDEFLQFAVSRSVALRCRCRQGMFVHSDRNMLCRAVKNLVVNGIKYSKPKGGGKAVVILNAIRLPTHLRIDVVDNGIGIPASEWHRIFEPFVQLGIEEPCRQNGLGLGLSIVNAMVSILDEHRLEMKSWVGQGTRFSIEVPKSAQPARDAPVSILASVADAPPSTILNGAYVLLVEDDDRVRGALETLLEQWQVLVESAASLAEFAALIGEVERFPDLVVTDYRLQGQDTGADVLRLMDAAWGARENGQRIPVLLLTGETKAAEICERIGAQAYLVKPVQPAVLQASMKALIWRSRSQAENLRSIPG